MWQIVRRAIWTHAPERLLSTDMKQQRWIDAFEWEAISSGRSAPFENRHIRRISDQRLYEYLASQLQASIRIALESELRRREAEAGPAGRAVRISRIAIVISIGALLVNAIDKF